MAVQLLERMEPRVEAALEDSDFTYFHALLNSMELMVKLVVSGMVAAMDDDVERQRYKQMYELVRADSLGTWSTVLNQIVKGPAARVLTDDAAIERQELSQRFSAGAWQFDATALLFNALNHVQPQQEGLPSKIDLLSWFEYATRLRNATKGHGAQHPGLLGETCSNLKQSIDLVHDNFYLFKRQWAFVRQNLSGKYKVIPLTSESAAFAPFRSGKETARADGIYVAFGAFISQVEMIIADSDVADYFVPNGAFTSAKFEVMSYVTGSVKSQPSDNYNLPPTPLPPSETHGLAKLDVVGRCHTNMPPKPSGYIPRPSIEPELRKVLLDYHHPIVTLAGSGGIGKTWLTLAILYEIANTDRFEAIIWFSSRDIDLLPHGAKQVRPAVLSRNDMAKEAVQLLEPSDGSVKGFNHEQFLARILHEPVLGPTLFVFDNFETVRNDQEMFSWIDAWVRPPNKVLITTRVREFKADYPVEIGGMDEVECDVLINAAAGQLGIKALLTESYRADLIQESSGHPYAIKVFLGEVASQGRLVNIERIAATKEQVLDALFERSYSALSSAAKRCFLTLCSRRSAVPALALEAILLRPENERMDVGEAIEMLRRYSIIEVVRSVDGFDYLQLPVAAFAFGRRKLNASAMKAAVDADSVFLRAFGPTQSSDIASGVSRQINVLFRTVADRIEAGTSSLDDTLPILEFVARQYPPAWLQLATLVEEVGHEAGYRRAHEFVTQFLENAAGFDGLRRDAWSRASRLSALVGDIAAELHEVVEMACCPPLDVVVVSDAANKVNGKLRDWRVESDEKRTVIARLASVASSTVHEANATDLSRFAWLHLQLGNEQEARRLTTLGLEKDEYNVHCLGLAERLNMPL